MTLRCRVTRDIALGPWVEGRDLLALLVLLAVGLGKRLDDFALPWEERHCSWFP